jgi:hypothetical protein
MDEAWEPSTEQCSFGNRRALERETIFTFILCPENFNGKRKKRGLDCLRPLRHGRSIFFLAKDQTRYCSWRAGRTCMEHNARYTPRHEVLCGIHGLHKTYKNVAMGQVKQPRGSQFGHPYFADWGRSGRRTSNCAGALVWGWKSTGSEETPVSGFCAHCNESSQLIDWAERQPTAHEGRLLLSERPYHEAACMLTCSHEHMRNL